MSREQADIVVEIVKKNACRMAYIELPDAVVAEDWATVNRIGERLIEVAQLEIRRAGIRNHPL